MTEKRSEDEATERRTLRQRKPVVLLTPLKSAIGKRMPVSQISPIKFKKTVISKSLTLVGMGQQRQQRKIAKEAFEKWRKKIRK